MSSTTRLLRAAIRSYQIFFSPFFRGVCRFAPSCSSYAHNALGQHPWPRALRLIAHRLLRCHPFGGCGFDPLSKEGI